MVNVYPYPFIEKGYKYIREGHSCLYLIITEFAILKKGDQVPNFTTKLVSRNVFFEETNPFLNLEET